MEIENKEDFFTHQKIAIEKHLCSLFLVSPVPQRQLFEATLYSLTTPAKRLRPLITLATIATLEGDLEKGLSPASALELIHTYSLIHDDLPCMDNDDFRRGMPSLHKQYGEAVALLTGDFLLTFAFDLLSSAEGLSDKQKLTLIQTLAKKAGANGIIGGQLVDLESEKQQITKSTLDFMHSHKTASLFIAAVEFGAIVSFANQATEQALIGFATHFGIAFQILDDIADSTSSDQKKEKATAVTLLGVEGAKQAAALHKEESRSYLERLEKPTPLLEYLLQKLG